MTRFYAMSIRAQLLLMAFIVALPAMGIIISSGLAQRKEAINNARTETQKLTDNIASEQQNLVAAAQQLVSALAQLPYVKSQDTARVQAILSEILRLNPQYLNIFIADRSGMMWASAVPMKSSFSISDRRYFRNAFLTGQFSSGEYIIGRIFGKPTISFGYPFRDHEGGFGGVIAINFDLDYCRQLLERSKLPEGSSYLLIDHKGVILSRGIHPEPYVGRSVEPEIFSAMQAGPDRETLMSPGIDGIKRFSTYRKLRLSTEQSPYMYIRVGIPVKSVVSKANRALFYKLAVFTPFLLAALFLGWLIGKRSIVDRISRLQEASRRLAEGDLNARVSDLVKGGELGNLGQAFDEMARLLALREQEQQKAAEEKKHLLEQLAQSQKMESIGRLAGGVAHDLNNLLTPILGYADLLKREYSHNARAVERLDHILSASEKAKRLIQQLLSFSRKQILDMKTIDLSQVLSSFYEILRRTIRENIDIRMHLSQERHGIRADKNQLEQIIMNLAINAQDAIEGNGSITFETAPVVLDEEYARQNAGVRPGRYFMLAVSDNGCGMDNETLSQIFEPFFTTKGVGKGSGLGLATVYGLVKQHEGNIWVYSEPGKGSIFKIYFPMVSDRPADEPAAVPDHCVLAMNCAILLVEDNKMVKDMVRDVLNNCGCTVIEAGGPRQALEMVNGKHLDLLVTDVVMPDMNGPELYRRLREFFPALKVLYMSGYTQNVIAHNGVLGQEVNFIQKPFAVHDFVRKIEEIVKLPVNTDV
jgi:signal transduction histidine kinase/ActR/RegA family two-component response regulator